MRIVIQIYPLIYDGELCCAVWLDCEIFHVPRVRALGIVQPVLFHIGIEVATSGSEGRLAFGRLMDVDGVLSGREILEIELDFYAAAFVIAHDGGADALSFGIL